MDGEHFCNRSINTEAEAQTVPIEEISNRFYIRMYTQDRPGILSEVSGVLGREKISISSVVQLETQEQDEYVPVVILTHSAPEASMARALQCIREFPFIRGEVACIRLFSDTS
jgi:homoserine dehydrogenase